MDRRQKKSRDAIFNAFNRLMEKKHFNHITVQEIIDEANVGRTTFYAHFDTKEMLLREMCMEIFDHIFSHELQSEGSHDFSGSEEDLRNRLTHLLFHLRDSKGKIDGLLLGESGELFIRYFREYLQEIFIRYPECMKKDVPEEFMLNQLTGSFSEAVKWWAKNGMKEEPEKIAEYYLKTISFTGGRKE